MTDLNTEVRQFWENKPCGTDSTIVGDLQDKTAEWFQRIEDYRYEIEPLIHSIAQFTRHHGKTLLEIGVGAGTDHLQWARAGAVCHGVDLTDVAIELTRRHLSLYGFKSQLKRIDAEQLPYADNTFDLVYSWGVIHHSENPSRIVREIRRVLKPGAMSIGMMYGRHSMTAFKYWVKFAALRGKPWRSFSDVIWHHMESIGTKAYTVRELKALFSDFTSFSAKPVITYHDITRWPAWISQFFPDRWGWFIGLKAIK
jgi:ubiquinone/menaquinone biosynthesis C-methylase UbiE